MWLRVAVDDRDSWTVTLALGVSLRLLAAEELTELLVVDEALGRIDDVTVGDLD